MCQRVTLKGKIRLERRVLNPLTTAVAKWRHVQRERATSASFISDRARAAAEQASDRFTMDDVPLAVRALATDYADDLRTAVTRMPADSVCLGFFQTES
jgi:hypothetical protein